MYIERKENRTVRFRLYTKGWHTMPEGKVEQVLTDAAVKALVKVASKFATNLGASALDKLRADIRDHADAHADFLPQYNNAAAAWRKRESKGAGDTYPVSSFVTYLESRMHALYPSRVGDSFPMNKGQVGAVIAFTGDVAEHDKLEPLFLLWCGVNKRPVTFGNYRSSFLAQVRADHLNKDGTLNDAGKVAETASDNEGAAVMHVRINSLNLRENLANVDKVVAIAWLTTLQEDAAALQTELSVGITTDERKRVADVIKKARSKGAVVGYEATVIAETPAEAPAS